MSTVVVAKKNGLVAIGADTLTKFGYTKESADYVEQHSKILKFGRNHAAFVGHASIGLVLESYLSKVKPLPRLDSIQNIFKFATRLHRSLKEEYFLNPTEHKDDEFESSQIDCLIANSSGIFGLYRLRSVQEYSRFYSFGSGYHLALGAMHAIYDKSESAEEIARAGLAAAAEFDDSTGFPIEIYSVKLKA